MKGLKGSAMRLKSILKWSDNMSVGVKEMDDDHKLVIDVVSSLYASRKGNPPEVVRQIFSSMRLHVIEHFRREEDILKNVMFDKIEEHIEVHNAFIERLTVLEDLMNSEESFVLSDDILNSVARWLFNHIMTEDKDYVVYAARSEALARRGEPSLTSSV
jgi:hemerythrin